MYLPRFIYRLPLFFVGQPDEKGYALWSGRICMVYGISPYSKLLYVLRNYLRDAWRHLIREKGFSTITIFGLALGLAAGIFITLFVVDEFGYDRYNTKADRIYRIAADIHINGPSINDVAT